MARQLRHWIAEPSTCAYLPSRWASLEYRLLLDVTGRELDALLERGWRRFGPAYFRPACSSCSACIPLRIPVDRFRLSKSQRRVWNKVKDRIRVDVGPPRVDDARLELYDRWHRFQGSKRDWPVDTLEADEYHQQFAFPHPCGQELTYWDTEAEDSDEPRLVGVAITDVTPSALSSVYTYYDPEYAHLSLGTASVLFQIEEARALGKAWVYLGYRVLGCRSSEYKARFQPHQLMVRGFALTEAPLWEDIDGRWTET